MTIFYIIVAVVVGIASLIGVGCGVWAFWDSMSLRDKSTARTAQKVVKVSLLFLVTCWIWPVTISLAILYGVTKTLRTPVDTA